MKRGIAVAGNIIVDVIKYIDRYPQRQALTYIRSFERALGGACSNVIRDLARMDPALHLRALGMIGDDADGDYALSQFAMYPNIDVSGVLRRGQTSYTDVMTESTGKARTFFAYAGASGLLTPEHFDIAALDVDLFHIGYILLLHGLDAPDPTFGTAMARLLHDLQAAGIATSVDIVSQSGAPFAQIVPPALRYTDYCIINEYEAAETTGIPLRDDDGVLLPDNMPEALGKLRAMGVKRWAVIHAPESSFGIDETGRFIATPSLRLPEGFIKGSVGAGDAFCAGVLYCAYCDQTLEKGLAFGAAAAACSLSEPGSSEGLRTADEVWKLWDAYGGDSGNALF